MLRRTLKAGPGTPLVLVHGLGGAASNWNQLVPALARRYRLLVPDLPGHGASSALPAVSGLGAYGDRVALVAERNTAVQLAFSDGVLTLAHSPDPAPTPPGAEPRGPPRTAP